MPLLSFFARFLRWILSFFWTQTIPSKDRAVLVTGAASGIGKATVDELLKRGCFVYAADVNTKSLEDQFKKTPNVKTLKMDVTLQGDVNSALDEIRRGGRGLYGLCNVAGIVCAGQIVNGKMVDLAAPELDVDKHVIPLYAVNTFGAMRTVSAFFSMILESQGCIVNVVSVAGRMPLPTASPYGSSKFALNGYTAALRREVKPYGVRVVSIEPGFVDTPLITYVKDTLAHDTSQTKFPDLFAKSFKVSQKLNAGGFITPSVVGKAIAEELFLQNPSLHRVVDRPAKRIFYYLISSLPHRWTEFLMDAVHNSV